MQVPPFGKVLNFLFLFDYFNDRILTVKITYKKERIFRYPYNILKKYMLIFLHYERRLLHG